MPSIRSSRSRSARWTPFDEDDDEIVPRGFSVGEMKLIVEVQMKLDASQDMSTSPPLPAVPFTRQEGDRTGELDFFDCKSWPGQRNDVEMLLVGTCIRDDQVDEQPVFSAHYAGTVRFYWGENPHAVTPCSYETVREWLPGLWDEQVNIELEVDDISRVARETRILDLLDELEMLDQARTSRSRLVDARPDSPRVLESTPNMRNDQGHGSTAASPAKSDSITPLNSINRQRNFAITSTTSTPAPRALSKTNAWEIWFDAQSGKKKPQEVCDAIHAMTGQRPPESLIRRAIFAKFGGQIDTIYDFDDYKQWVTENKVTMGDEVSSETQKPTLREQRARGI